MDNDGLGWSSPSEQAMLNPLVLSTLFEYCAVEDLTACRLVSRVWHSSSLSQWRSRAKLRIVGDRIGMKGAVGSYRKRKARKGDANCGCEDEDDRPTLMEFLEWIYSYEEEETCKMISKPFQNVVIYGGLKDNFDFFLAYGLHLKSLSFNYCMRSTIDILKRVLLELTPNLEKLGILGHSFGIQAKDPVGAPLHEYPEQEKIKIFKVDMASMYGGILPLGFQPWFDKFPNIHTLVVRHIAVGIVQVACGGEENENGTVENLIDFMRDIVTSRRNFPTKLNLKHFDIENVCQPAIRKHTTALVRALREANFSLETLKIDLGLRTEESVAQQLLQIHSTTLKTLRCYRGALVPPYKDFLGEVSFESLEKLTLSGAVALNLDFLRNTPNLEILHHFTERSKIDRYLNLSLPGMPEPEELNIDLGHGFNIGSTNENLNLHLEKMKELKAEFEIVDPTWFRVLVRWMPNMVRLEVSLTKETFQVVCTSWGNTLRELTLPRCNESEPAFNIDDEVLTGIPRGWPKRQSRFSMSDRPANITSLRVLEIFSDARPQSKCLSNHSVANGFNHLPNLRRISVNHRLNQANIGDSALSSLKAKFVQVKFSN